MNTGLAAAAAAAAAAADSSGGGGRSLADRGLVRPADDPEAAHLGFGRIVVSEIETPSLLLNMV
jgi:hypothetical protein